MLWSDLFTVPGGSTISTWGLIRAAPRLPRLLLREMLPEKYIAEMVYKAVQADVQFQLIKYAGSLLCAN